MANLKLKVIKSKDFTANEEAHTHYTCAYKGRVFGVSTMSFNEGDFTVDNKVLTVTVDVELKKDSITDSVTNQVTQFLSLVPKFELALSEI